MKPKQNTILLFLIFIICSFLTITPLNKSVKNAATDMLVKTRGDQHVNPNLLFVYIGQEDIQALNGWPITRDYYAYITHILKTSGVRVIAFDLLFDTPDKRYPEYDADFAEFLQSDVNIALPMVYSDFQLSDTDTTGEFFQGQNPRYPVAEFKNHADALGFSNLGDETIVRSVPVTALFENKPVFSFGLELARLYLSVPEEQINVTKKSILMNRDGQELIKVPIDKHGQLCLYHLGNISSVNSIGFVDLLTTLQNNPDSLNLSDKLVYIAVTSPGLAPLKVTPFSSAFPASLLHLTVAENIIGKKFIKQLSVWPDILICFLIFIGVVFFSRDYKRTIITAGVFFIIYLILVYLLFRTMLVVLPVFWPLTSLVLSLAAIGLLKIRQRQKKDMARKNILRGRITEKEKELFFAQQKYDEIFNQLNAEKLEKQTISEKAQQQLEQKQKDILLLKNQLDDLYVYETTKSESEKVVNSEIVHTDKSPLVHILNMIKKISADDIPVLILGETGSGKELVARCIHQNSHRNDKQFIAVNCGALSETLLESELFGHEKGSFTGAQAQRRGRFELADGGTLFLDEVTETSSAFQAKLLRVLQEGTFERLGSEKTLKVDVRIIAATGRNIQDEIAAERFRMDLYYRLNGFPVQLPPLRDRKMDIPALVEHFLFKYTNDKSFSFSEQIIKQLSAYSFPGNVRELENIVRHAALLAKSEGRHLLQSRDLPQDILKNHTPTGYVELEDQILESLRTLEFSHSAISKTAKALGNRDRGTITEYFKGICFKYYYENDFDQDKAARIIAGSAETQIVQKVTSKLKEYLKNLSLPSRELSETDFQNLPQLKGLPQKYHEYAIEIIKYFLNKENDDF